MVAEGNDELMEEFFEQGTIGIEHLVSGERCYFTRYSKLIVFMLNHLPRAALQLDLPLRLLPLMHRLTQRFRRGVSQS